VVIDVHSGAQTPFELDWDWTADGWIAAEWPPLPMALSTDGQWVLLRCMVGSEWLDIGAPDLLMTGEALVYAACRPDGSEARAVAVTYLAWHLPLPHITAEPARLIGYELYNCAPDAEHCRAYVEGGKVSDPHPLVNYVELESGERGRFDFLPPGVYFDRCPFSDYALLDDWDGNLTFYDLMTGEETGSFSCDPDALYADGDGAYSWVLPDAILVSFPPKERLVSVDGAVRTSPTSAIHRIRLALAGSTAIYQQVGEDDGYLDARYGELDYETFSAKWWAKRPDLGHIVYSLLAMPDGSGALQYGYQLKYLPLGREHAGEVVEGE
jgi:hypothetical protein